MLRALLHERDRHDESLNDLHRGRSSGGAWSGVIDPSAAFLIVVSLTGLLMLLYLKRTWASAPWDGAAGLLIDGTLIRLLVQRGCGSLVASTQSCSAGDISQFSLLVTMANRSRWRPRAVRRRRPALFGRSTNGAEQRNAARPGLGNPGAEVRRTARTMWM